MTNNNNETIKTKGYRIDPEIKQQILKRIKEEGVTAPEVARQHGISDKTVYGWLAKGEGSSQLKTIKLERENQALLKLVGELTRELSRSKKNKRY